jgi:hypothetical protein
MPFVSDVPTNGRSKRYDRLSIFSTTKIILVILRYLIPVPVAAVFQVLTPIYCFVVVVVDHTEQHSHRRTVAHQVLVHYAPPATNNNMMADQTGRKDWP